MKEKLPYWCPNTDIEKKLKKNRVLREKKSRKEGEELAVLSWPSQHVRM